jgi:HK97 family phage major capsid protein
MTIFEQEAARRIINIARVMRPPGERFDLMHAIRFCATNPEGRLPGYEGERSTELASQHKHHLPVAEGYGFYCDGSDLEPLVATRADTVLAASAGGYAVETELSPSFIELARARSVIGAFGATFLPDLVGNVAFGRVSGTSISTSWSSTEMSAPSDGIQTFSQVSMSPKQVAVNVRQSRSFMTQTSPAAQTLAANDLVAAVGQAADVAALSVGAGSGAPVGIPTLAANSISGASASNSTVVSLQGYTAKRLSPAAGYCAPVATAQTLSERFRDSTNVAFYIWEDGLYDGRVAGCRAIASDNVPSGTLIFGNWDQLLVGSWGPIFVEVSPYGLSAADFLTGTIALRVILLMDVALRDPLAFSVATAVS